MTSLALCGGLLAAGCGGDKRGEAGDAARTGQPGAPVERAQLTGDTIIVEMHSDALGNYYKPNEIEAHQGDVVRWVLVSGVHNVNFLPDSNAIKTGLPPASDMLQLPGQTYDLVVSLADGKYYFQCDPHAALGMIGYLEVEDE